MHIRLANRDDTPTILDFIKHLAEYEKLAHEVEATPAQLEKTMFGEHRYAECLLAEDSGTAMGFALFFHNYSTFLAKPGLYLEDLFVSPDHRGKGIGKALLKELAKIAIDRDCGRLEWWVLDWNESAISFYKSLGATPMDEWTTFRITGDALTKLANT